MKNFSKTIAGISMSLFAVGAMAQSALPNTVQAIPNVAQRAIAPQGSLITHKLLSNTHKVSSNTSYAFLDYPYVDSVWQANFGVPYSSDPSILRGLYIQPMNGHYVEGDTGKPNTNNLLIQACAVSFDTLVDANTLNSDYTTQGVVVDSLYIPIGQQNISGNKDSIIVSINTVGDHGIPTNKSLWSATLVNDTGFVGKGKSWLYSTVLTFAPNITVPGTGKFAVVMTYLATNKRDSMGFLYAYPEFSCSTPSESMPDTTLVGQIIPVTTNKGVKPLMANSFTTGYTYFITGHKNVAMLPDTVNGDFVGFDCTSPNVFSAGPFQDIIMLAEVSYVSTLGVNNISQTSGLSVAQNYPNPFNKQTTINYSLTKSANVTFTVYDITGRALTTTNYGNVAPGQYQINLNANTFSPGVYFYTFNVGGSTITKKMVITE